MKFDLHIHTSRHSPDSQLDPFVLTRRARELGLDGVVITEHDWLWQEAELDVLRALSPPGLVVLAGVEVSAREGHFLAYGVTDPFAIPRGISVKELCDVVHRQGGVVVGAHPFRWGQPFRDIVRRHKPALDGVELMTNNMDADMRRQAAAVRAELNIAGLGCSDAHHEDTLAACFTDFDADVRTTRDLVEAIRARKATAHDRAGRPTCLN
jgi:predicted metal-dependent phosphoesterase TrpH